MRGEEEMNRKHWGDYGLLLIAVTRVRGTLAHSDCPILLKIQLMDCLPTTLIDKHMAGTVHSISLSVILFVLGV